MKIRGMLVTGAVAFLALLVVILGLTVQLLTSGGGDAQYINLAGRQRMLSQKLSKEMLTYIATPTAKNLDQLEKTSLVFTRTHQALRSGGKAPSKLDNTSDVEVGAPTDPGLLAKLDEVNQNWLTLTAAVQKLEAAGAKRGEAMAKIAEDSAGLLATMDQAVSLYGARDSALSLNVAGRQRMLSQKLGKEALLYVSDLTPELKAALHESMILFGKSHKALRVGGETTVGGQTVSIEAASSPAVLAKLDAADRLWKDMESNLNLLTTEGLNPEARAQFYDTNPKVLKGMDEAVTLAEQVSNAKIKTLQNAQIGMMVLGLVLVLLTIMIASKIGAAIAKLQKAAEEISLGQVSKPVEIGGIGELKDLSGAFERMRVSLALAVQQLGGDDEGDSAPMVSSVTASAPAARKRA